MPELTKEQLAEIEDLIAEIRRLRRAVESWKAEEQAWHEERKTLANRAEFWRAETERRAECLKRLEAVPLDCDGSVSCPDCDQPEGHLDECELFCLMTMPEEPKP